VIGLGEGASMRVVASHVTLPGGYHLLMGRESVRFESLVERFWYGIAVAVAIVLGLGAVLARLLRRIEIEQLVEERTGALRRSEERYAIALSSGEEGFWDWDLATDAYHASPRLLEMCGFPRDSTFANRAEFLARFPFAPGEREKWVAGVEAHFAGTSDRMDREVAILRDGETRWLQTSGLATRGASGAVVRWTGAMRDITERRRAEEALRLSEQRYARAMDAAEAGHWEWNVATDEMFVSARQREMLEIPLELQFARREDYLARIPLHPEDRERYIATARRHIAEAWPRFEQEFRVILKSGELRWLRLTGKSHRNAEGRPTHFTGSLIDITERKLAADALRASEERYSLAMEASQEGHFDADLDTDQLYISERLNEIYGFAPGTQFASRTEYLRSFQFHADDGERYLAALKAVEAKGGPERYEFEYRIVRASGEIRWLRTRGKVIRDAEGRARRRSGVVTDITERKLAADALRESEGRYARAMEATEAGHWEWDLVTHQVFHSPRFRELYGIGLDETFADRETWKARQPLGPSERERQERALQEAIADPAKNYDIELSFELRPGEVRWLRSRGKVFRNEHGRPLRVTGATTDITARKLAEDGLRASEERYALAMEAAGDGHIDWNLVTGEFYISPRLLRILGYPPGTTFADRADWVRRFPFHPEDRPRWEAAIAAHFAGREATFRMDLRIVVKGETRWVAFTFIATRDPAGKPVRWTGSIADINDAKLAEEALRESQERYALAVAGSDDGVWDCDFAARRVFISARARELAGMPPGPEIVPMDEWFARLPLHPEDVAPRTAALQAHLSGKTPAYVGEFRLRQPDGRYHWRRLHGLCLRDAHGEPLRMAGSISDIDDRRRAEEGLRLSEERYALALEASEEGHFDIDLETDEIFVSARVNDIYGFPRQARIANRTEFLNQIPFHPDDRHLLADIISSDWDDPARVKRLERYTLRIVPRPGETRWIQTNAMVTRDAQGRARRRVGVIADITERKLAEEARRLSEERYALAMEASEEGHFDWNVRTDEIFASTHLKKLLDLPEDQQFPTRGDMIARVRYYPGDRAHLEQITREVLASGALQNEFEYRLLRGPAGETRWIRARWKILRDADGAPLSSGISYSLVESCLPFLVFWTHAFSWTILTLHAASCARLIG
jgi:PAS domain S-box-containing protein